MKTTIRVENLDGTISVEHEIELSDDDQLVIHFTDMRLFLKFNQVRDEVLKGWDKAKILALPPGCELKVLRKIKKEEASE